MHSSLGLLLFSVLLRTGASLECETCTALGSQCTGTQQTCAVGQDICAIILSEVSIVGRVQSIMKTCSSSRMCKTGASYVNLAQGKSGRTQTFCCVGEACRTASVQLPPVNTTANGLHCPGCYSMSETCPEEVVYCTGLEKYCFDSKTKVATEGIEVEVVMKGCTNELGCSSVKHNPNNLVGVSIKAECSPANKAPSVSAYPLLAFSVLLLMKPLLL